MPITPRAKLEQVVVRLDEEFELDYTHEVLEAEKFSSYDEESKQYIRCWMLLVLRRGL